MWPIGCGASSYGFLGQKDARSTACMAETTRGSEAMPFLWRFAISPALLAEEHCRCSHLRLIDSCITQLKAQGPSRTCNESKEEDCRGTVCMNGARIVVC